MSFDKELEALRSTPFLSDIRDALCAQKIEQIKKYLIADELGLGRKFKEMSSEEYFLSNTPEKCLDECKEIEYLLSLYKNQVAELIKLSNQLNRQCVPDIQYLMKIPKTLEFMCNMQKFIYQLSIPSMCDQAKIEMANLQSKNPNMMKIYHTLKDFDASNKNEETAQKILKILRSA